MGSWTVLRSRFRKKLNRSESRLIGLPLSLLLLVAMTVIAVAIFSSRVQPLQQENQNKVGQLADLKTETRLNNRTDLSKLLQIRDKQNDTPRRSTRHDEAFASELNKPQEAYHNDEASASEVNKPQEAYHNNEASASEENKPQEAYHQESDEGTLSSGGLGIGGGPYHDWNLFEADYKEMHQNLKIYVYPDISLSQSPFANVFLPNPNPFNPKLGNYFSEHAFKMALLQSSLITHRPEEAHFFFMPFSINTMRNDPRIHSDAAISEFVAQYVNRISAEFKYWNASKGVDHFYVCCHSVCKEAASRHLELRTNAIQITCSSSYFQRFYVPHKDVGLPQVWPRQPQPILNPPEARNKLVFFAGRIQNSVIRQEILELWGNDPSMDINSGNSSYPYEIRLSKSRYCLHVKGYEVNTARVSDAILHGCIPVIISNYYELPLSNLLDWSKFSIIINHMDIVMLKRILLSIPKPMYLNMYNNLSIVRKHFMWHRTPTNYDSFHMTAYQLWLRRGLIRLP